MIGENGSRREPNVHYRERNVDDGERMVWVGKGTFWAEMGTNGFASISNLGVFRHVLDKNMIHWTSCCNFEKVCPYTFNTRGELNENNEQLSIS